MSHTGNVVRINTLGGRVESVPITQRWAQDFGLRTGGYVGAWKPPRRVLAPP